ncbi:MAG TPA: LacI family DNA-binding transcriptional regulator [Chthoniobacteraceae bacterium]|nr:LacI family DNA-binding transcriptional regulator [Chthoniobacteraceae bacterium]
MKRVTQSDIAKALGISQVTVGLVVGNGKSPLRNRLAPETVSKIQEKARELGYVPDRAAQIMRNGRTNLIVLLNFSGYSELASQRVYHIGRLANEAGFDFQVIDVYWWASSAQRIVDQISGLRPQGLIIVGAVQNDFGVKHIEALQQKGIAMVAIGTQIRGGMAGVPLVRYDARLAMATFTRWCLENGSQRPVLVMPYHDGLSGWQARERLAGYQAAFLEMTGHPPAEHTGLEEPPLRPVKGVAGVVLTAPKRRNAFKPFQLGVIAMKSFLNWSRLPDALICVNDDFAIGVLSVCSRHGIAVPGQLMVTGFDNIAYAAQGSVTLTSAEHPTAEMCELAFELLKERLGKTPASDEREAEHLLPCRIVWRESTGHSFDPEEGCDPTPAARDAAASG